jgi:hypothetical protein
MKISETEHQLIFTTKNPTGVFGFGIHKKFRHAPMEGDRITQKTSSKYTQIQVGCMGKSGEVLHSAYINVDYAGLVSIKKLIDNVINGYDKE